MSKPIITSEYYQIQSNFSKPEAEIGTLKGNFIDFGIDCTDLINKCSAVQIDVVFEIINKNDIVVCKLVNRAIFNIANLEKDQETFKLLEQLFYKSYDAFLKSYDYHYKYNSIINTHDPILPIDIKSDVKLLFDSLFV